MRKQKVFSAFVGTAFLAAWLVSSSPQPASATTVAPSKIVEIVLENQAYQDIAYTGCQASPQWDPYICAHLVENGGAGSGGISDIGALNIEGTGTHGVGTGGVVEGVQNGTSKKYDGSSYMYMYLTSGDGCQGRLATDSGDQFYNASNANTNYTTTQCGNDIFTQMDSNSVSWKMFQEDFASGVTCQQGYSDNSGTGGSNHQEYTRKHNPATFYNNVNADCSTGGSSGNVVNLDGYGATDTGAEDASVDAVGHPFQSATLSSFNMVVPDLCHDMHNNESVGSSSGHTLTATSGSTTITSTGASGFTSAMVGKSLRIEHDGTFWQAKMASRTSGTVAVLDTAVPSGWTTYTGDAWESADKANCTTGGVADAWGNPAPPAGLDGWTPVGQYSTTTSSQIYEGDRWLAYNLPDILDKLGPTGVAIVTWDEDGCGGGSCTGAQQIPTFVVPGTGGSLNATTGRASTTYDLSSILHTIINNYSGLACSSLDTDGNTNCSTGNGANLLPVTLNAKGTVLHIDTSSNSTAGTSYTITPAVAPVVGHYLILGVGATAGVTVNAPTTPSTWTSAAVTQSDQAIFYHKVLAGETYGAISGTLSASAVYSSVLEEVSGLNASEASVLDKTDTKSSGSGTATSLTPTTAATTQVDEIVFGLTYVNNTAALTTGISATGYTSTSQWDSTKVSASLGYKVVSATGTQSYATSWAPAYKARAAVATFKLA